jgi:two-component system, sensor histidine kinase and response regulator
MQPEMTGDILLVDDRRENLIALEGLLGSLGQRLVRAESGMAALKCLLRQEFAVILLDVQMPDMDGFETAQLIRSRAQSEHTPIIFVTAFNRGEQDVERGYKLGAVDFLFKPINPEILRSKVAVFVDLYKKTLEIRRNAERMREIEQREHEREMAEARRRWETERLREEVEREKAFTRQLEENYRRLQELEKLRDDLTHMIVHDLRTPLTSVLSGLRTLACMEGLGPDHCEILEMSLSGGETLLCMINDLLDISKLENGSMKLHVAEHHPADLVSAAMTQVQSLSRERGVRLLADLPEGLKPVLADGDKVVRALVNLLGNALKFTPRGGTVSVSAYVDGASGCTVFAVKDTGEGIPRDSFERIFEKFGQVDSRKRGRKMSTGLGLTFCKLVTEAHGGRIWVESELGKGSLFQFTIPEKTPEASGAKVMSAMAEAA